MTELVNASLGGMALFSFTYCVWSFVTRDKVGWTDLQDQIWKLRDKLGKVACAEVEASLLRANANTTYNSKLLALGRALGWRYEEATNDHLARWVPCADASAATAVERPASLGDVLTVLHTTSTPTGTTGPAAGFSQFSATVYAGEYGHAPKPKRARGSSTGATRKGGKSRG